MEPTLKLTKTHLSEGIWEGVITSTGAPDARPRIEVTHLEKPLDGVELTPRDGGLWVLRVPIPAHTLSDGVQTFLIRDQKSGETLDTFTLIAGEALGDDIRAEIDLLRAELDMLKRAFRRHCLETM